MARRAGPKHSTSVEETYARGRMGALAALATLALVGTGAAGAFAATTIPQSDATSEDATPSVSMLADDADTPAVITEDATIEAPAEEAVTEPPADPTPAPAPEVTNPTDTTAPTPTETSKPAGEGEVATTKGPVQADATPDEAKARSLKAGVTPMGLGPDGGTPPYVYWDVRDAADNLVPGVTFEIQGPRTGGTGTQNNRWNSNSRTVTDCQTAPNPCPAGSRDLDPDPGEFLIKYMSADATGTPVSTASRYRVRMTNVPTGYGPTGNQPWVELPAAGTTTQTINTPASNAWVDQTHNFGTFQVQRQVGTITVKKSDRRSGAGTATAGNRSGQYTQGARFVLYSSQTATTPITGYTNPLTNDGFCEISSNGGDCVFQNVPVGTYWVGEITPKSGSSAESSYEPPIGKLSTGSLQNYRYQVTVTNNGNATAPATNAASSGAFANRLKNPDLQMSCQAGVKVAIVLDVSGSIKNGQQNDLAKATTAFIRSLEGTPSQVALFTFSTASPGTVWNNGNTTTEIVGNFPDLVSVQTADQANTVIKRYATNNTGDTWKKPDPSGGTNWDSAFWVASQANTASNHYDLVFVLTDGNPTYMGTTAADRSGSGNSTTFQEIEWGTYSSNVLKAQGTRVVGVGVGEGVSGYNLASFTGDRAWSAGSELKEIDYIQANWDQLAKVLKDFAKGLACEASVEVKKQTQIDDASPILANGWTFGLAKEGDGAIEGSNPQVTGAGSNSTGTAEWTIKFDQPTQVATSVTLTETPQTGWTLGDVACSVNGTAVSTVLNPDGKSVTLDQNVGIGKSVSCTFTNKKASQNNLKVSKSWTINGGDPILDKDLTAAQKEMTGSAVLTLDPAPSDVTSPSWETEYAYTTGQKVTVGETLTPPENSNCRVDSSIVTKVNDSETSTTLGGGFKHTMLATPKPNTVELTNNVICTQSLTLVKAVEGVAEGLASSGVTSNHWILGASGPTPIQPGNSGTTTPVDPGEYTLSEALKDGAPDAAKAYTQKGDWACVGGTASAGSTVTVGIGQNVTCTVTNQPAEISVLKSVEGGTSPGNDPANWTVSATSPSDSGLPSLDATGAVAPSSGNSVVVKPGEQYTLAEAAGASAPAFLQKALQKYTAADAACPAVPTPASLADADCWITVTNPAVTVEQGQRAIYRFVNFVPTGPDLPLTGGQSAAMFTILGGGLLAGALALTAIRRRKGGARRA